LLGIGIVTAGALALFLWIIRRLRRRKLRKEKSDSMQQLLDEKQKKTILFYQKVP
jgi:hypothetical protein